MLAHLASVIVLAFAVSLDGFGVGVTYGLRRIRIPLLSVIIIACCSGLIIWLSMQAGSWLSGVISEHAANIAGAAILIAIGCWALTQLLRTKEGADSESGSSASEDQAAEALPLAAGSASPSTVLLVELKRLGLVIQILRTPQAADVDRSGTISSSEALMLGTALSLDAFGAGLGAALLGLPALLTAVAIAVTGALFLIAGTRLGIRLSPRKGMHAISCLPGILLIVLGITKLL